MPSYGSSGRWHVNFFKQKFHPLLTAFHTHPFTRSVGTRHVVFWLRKSCRFWPWHPFCHEVAEKPMSSKKGDLMARLTLLERLKGHEKGMLSRAKLPTAQGKQGK